MTDHHFALIATGIVLGALAASIMYDHKTESSSTWWDLTLAALGAV
jgi:hypothetical protein